ncbi:MAG: plastocyanin/azurin family copper-binding protein [Longimicrobiales bacterium]
MWSLVLLGVLTGMALQGRDRLQVGTVGSAAADTAVVAVRTFQFRPAQLEVVVGATVVWVNEDEIEHTATAGTAEMRDSLFALPLARKGERAAFTFEKPGTYAYHCARHPFMRGELRVTLKGETR